MKNYLSIIFLYFFIIILSAFKNVNCEHYNKLLTDLDFINVLRSLSSNTIINANRKVVFFKIKQQKKTKKAKKNLDVVMGYLYQFLISSGVDCDIYNWAHQHYVAVTKIDSMIPRSEILSRFSDIIDDVAQQNAKEVLENLTGEKLKDDF